VPVSPDDGPASDWAKGRGRGRQSTVAKLGSQGHGQGSEPRCPCPDPRPWPRLGLVPSVGPIGTSVPGPVHRSRQECGGGLQPTWSGQGPREPVLRPRLRLRPRAMVGSPRNEACPGPSGGLAGGGSRLACRTCRGTLDVLWSRSRARSVHRGLGIPRRHSVSRCRRQRRHTDIPAVASPVAAAVTRSKGRCR